jgi:hypothetical protein
MMGCVIMCQQSGHANNVEETCNSRSRRLLHTSMKILSRPVWLILSLLRSGITTVPTEVRVGGLFPMYKTEVLLADIDTASTLPTTHIRAHATVSLHCRTCRCSTQAAGFGLDGSGVRRFTSAYLAMREINDKGDGIADSLLPNTQLKLAFRDSKRSPGFAFFGALQLGTEAFYSAGVSAIIGAASSGPSSSAALVTAQLQARSGYAPDHSPENHDIFWSDRVAATQIPQISYSATSPTLSNGKQYTYFLRTPPSDALEGEAIADLLVNGFGYKKVATVNSDDSCALHHRFPPMRLCTCNGGLPSFAPTAPF